MKPLLLSELPSAAAFAQIRPTLRQAVIAHKAARRVAIGDRVTLVFENRETVRWQVLEMCRVEGLTEPAAIQHELDVYNALLPGPGELSATLFIEITNLAEVREELDRLVGMDERVALRVGDDLVRATFDPSQMDEDRISAVHYVRFSLPEEAREAFSRPGTALTIEIDHPAYQARCELSADTRASLAADLEGGCPELQPLGDLPRADVGDEDKVVRTRGKVRLLRPAHPRAPGHHIAEPTVPGAAFLDAPPDLLAELLALVQETARKIEAEHGSCRVVISEAATPLRIDLFAPPRARG
ncbi:MAG: hypothetical protein CL910_06690 [Deltaproteobacteria bacterium]|jgi:hypothetical protein|nr:hypothetical protein [Deltaproteobacteria bacterium]